MPTEWRNKRGKSLWQPTVASGERLWWQSLWGDWEKRWGYRGTSDDRPVLYSRRRAERAERREQERRRRYEYDETFREVRRAEG